MGIICNKNRIQNDKLAFSNSIPSFINEQPTKPPTRLRQVQVKYKFPFQQQKEKRFQVLIYEQRYKCCQFSFYALLKKLLKQAQDNFEHPLNFGFKNLQEQSEWFEMMAVAIFAYKDKKEMLNTIFKEKLKNIEMEAFSIIDEKQPDFFKELIFLFSINQSSDALQNRYLYIDADYSFATEILNIQIKSTIQKKADEEVLAILTKYVRSVYSQHIKLFQDSYLSQPITILCQQFQKKNVNQLTFFLMLLCSDQEFCLNNLILQQCERNNSEILKDTCSNLKQQIYPEILQKSWQDLIIFYNQNFCSNHDNQLWYLSPCPPCPPCQPSQLQLNSLPENEFQMKLIKSQVIHTNRDKHLYKLFSACQKCFAILYSQLLMLILELNSEFFSSGMSQEISLAVFSYLDKKQILSEAQKQEIKTQQIHLLEFFDFFDNQQVREIQNLFQGEKSIYYKLEEFSLVNLNLAHKILDVQIETNTDFDLGFSILYLIQKFIQKCYSNQINVLVQFYKNNDSESIDKYCQEQKFPKLFIFAALQLIYSEYNINKKILIEYFYLLGSEGDLFKVTKKLIINDLISKAILEFKKNFWKTFLVHFI